jgi:hypothetical protein
MPDELYPFRDQLIFWRELLKMTEPSKHVEEETKELPLLVIHVIVR